ncbi:DUF805 domain-containing protein [Polaribacter sp. MED152]|uniref:DUF805 domain-containing protein n=1 Tax=Polaribacter sp. MED152 TaxID=313598 RepID=UPI000068C7F9|nr:DUF805 domain-containing protein [Polaribacter sp. MED152]EAQ41484.1 protein of unknown function (DUF805) [Polaribacter sp. MED152]
MNWYLKVLRQYADFKGRARRKEFWMFYLFNTIITLFFRILDHLLGTNYGDYDDQGILESIYGLIVIIPFIAVTARRMHDVGKSGWFMLIPFYNFYLSVIDGEPHANKWGDNPKGIGNDSMINQIGKE